MKKKISFMLIVLNFVILELNAQSNSSKKLIDLETKLMNSWKNKDLKTSKELLSDDFQLISSLSHGELTDKSEYLKLVMERGLNNFNIDSILVSNYEKVAIVTVWITRNAVIKGKDWSGKFLYTDVWINTDETWRIIRRHSSWINKK